MAVIRRTPSTSSPGEVSANALKEPAEKLGLLDPSPLGPDGGALLSALFGFFTVLERPNPGKWKPDFLGAGSSADRDDEPGGGPAGGVYSFGIEDLRMPLPRMFCLVVFCLVLSVERGGLTVKDGAFPLGAGDDERMEAWAGENASAPGGFGVWLLLEEATGLLGAGATEEVAI